MRIKIYHGAIIVTENNDSVPGELLCLSKDVVLLLVVAVAVHAPLGLLQAVRHVQFRDIGLRGRLGGIVWKGLVRSDDMRPC